MSRLFKAALVGGAMLLVGGGSVAAAAITPSEGAVRSAANTMTASILGPSTVGSHSTCTWSGSADGGVAPYTFYWISSQGDQGIGVNFEATAPESGPMEISLYVEDANLTPVSVEKIVLVSTSKSGC